MASALDTFLVRTRQSVGTWPHCKAHCIRLLKCVLSNHLACLPVGQWSVHARAFLPCAWWGSTLHARFVGLRPGTHTHTGMLSRSVCCCRLGIADCMRACIFPPTHSPTSPHIPMCTATHALHATNQLVAALRSPSSSVDGGSAVVPRVRLVLGNESADLDSVACALVYAFFLSTHNHHHHHHHHHPQSAITQPLGGGGSATTRASAASPTFITVPIVNTPRADLPLRTDVKWMLDRARVDWTHLFFCDDEDVARLRNSGPGPCPVVESVVLVDHNRVTAGWERVSELVDAIIDHHEDRGDHPRASRTIRPSGSCASLIALAMDAGSASVDAGRAGLAAGGGGGVVDGPTTYSSVGVGSSSSGGGGGGGGGGCASAASLPTVAGSDTLSATTRVSSTTTTTSVGAPRRIVDLGSEATELLIAAILADTAGLTNRVTSDDEAAMALLSPHSPLTDPAELWRGIQRVKYAVLLAAACFPAVVFCAPRLAFSFFRSLVFLFVLSLMCNAFPFSTLPNPPPPPPPAQRQCQTTDTTLTHSRCQSSCAVTTKPVCHATASRLECRQCQRHSHESLPKATSRMRSLCTPKPCMCPCYAS
jgi:inorganic pyrophosphatase/exopolyphosphatase